MRTTPSSPLLLAGALTILLAGCAGGDAAERAAPAAAGSDMTGAARELLAIAAAAAARVPTDSHVKTRSRLQEEVVHAHLRLDDPDGAVRQAGSIPNWRRGTACAAVAAWHARHGGHAEADRLLALAEAVARERAGDASEQAWRVDRIHAAVAEVRARLAEARPAAAAGLTRAARDAVANAEAAFARDLERIDRALASTGFDELRQALDACVELYARHADGGRRAALAARLRGGGATVRVPGTLRVDALARAAEAALSHGDPTDAAAFVAAAAAVADGLRLLPADALSLAARLAALRCRTGDGARGREELLAAADRFAAARPTTPDIDRADVLRAIAEAWHEAGDPIAATATYAAAVAAGTENPNSIPRAEDLVATCLSMARRGFAPAPALRARLRAVAEGLRAPW